MGGNFTCSSQGLILRPLLFNTFLYDLSLIINSTDFASYVDDNHTPYTIGNDVEDVTQRLQAISKSLFQWFSDSEMKANSDKCR